MSALAHDLLYLREPVQCSCHVICVSGSCIVTLLSLVHAIFMLLNLLYVGLCHVIECIVCYPVILHADPDPPIQNDADWEGI